MKISSEAALVSQTFQRCFIDVALVVERFRGGEERGNGQ